MKKNSFSAEEVKSKEEKERVVQSWEEVHREPFMDQFVTQQVTALAVSQHLAHPGFFSLQPGDLSLPKY